MEIKAINIFQRNATRNRRIELRFANLDPSTVHLVVYSDTSFASNEDGSSELGDVFLFKEAVGRATVFHYTSKEAKRVVHSVLWEQIISYDDAVDIPVLLPYNLHNFHQRDLSMRVLNEISSLYYAVLKSIITTKKLLAIDLLAVREAVERHDITEIRWIREDLNPADGLTKRKAAPPPQGLRPRRSSGL